MVSWRKNSVAFSLYNQVVRQQSRAILTLSIVFILIVSVEMFYSFRQQVAKNLHQNAKLIELTVIPALQFQDSRSLKECLEILAREKLIQKAYLKDAKGTMLASFTQKDRALNPDKQAFWEVYNYEHPIIDGNDTLAVLYIERSLDDLAEIHSRAALAMFGTSIMLLLASRYLRRRMGALLEASFKSLNQCIDSLAHNRSPNISEVKAAAAIEFYGVIEHFDSMAVAIRSRDESLKKINEELERRVNTRTEEIKNLHEKLVLEAHKAGMADLASGIIHNFGNILNSLMIETQKIKEYQDAHGTKQHTDQLFAVLKPDGIRSILDDQVKSEIFFKYVDAIRMTVDKDNVWFQDHLLRMIEQQKVMQSMLHYQQNFVQDKEPLQTVYAHELIELALKIKETSVKKRGVRMEVQECPHCLVQVKKSKVIHVITNLIVNAMDAMNENEEDKRVIRIQFSMEEQHLRLRFEDNGSGIAKDSIDKVFKQGFTTKQTGHGFGLHSSANYMTEMSGTLELAKLQPLHGAAFELTMKLYSAANDSASEPQLTSVASGI